MSIRNPGKGQVSSCRASDPITHLCQKYAMYFTQAYDYEINFKNLC